MLKRMRIHIFFRVFELLKGQPLGRFAGVLACIAYLTVSGYSQAYPCLPSNITEDIVVRVVQRPVVKKISVRQTLKDLKVKCSRGRLIDGKKREIKFYSVVGCWGNPPEDYLEIQRRQRRELAELKSKFTVVELSCDVSGEPLYRIP